MVLPTLSPEQLPEDVRKRLQKEERVYHFAFIDQKGGCGSASTARHWLLVTDQRILFEAQVRSGFGSSAGYVHQSGSIPMSKVSYIGVATEQRGGGCSGRGSVSVHHLQVNSSGGEIVLVIPTKEEADRIQSVVESVLLEKE